MSDLTVMIIVLTAIAILCQILSSKLAKKIDKEGR